jgi:hypothetical protein
LPTLASETIKVNVTCRRRCIAELSNMKFSAPSPKTIPLNTSAKVYTSAQSRCRANGREPWCGAFRRFRSGSPNTRHGPEMYCRSLVLQQFAERRLVLLGFVLSLGNELRRPGTPDPLARHLANHCCSAEAFLLFLFSRHQCRKNDAYRSHLRTEASQKCNNRYRRRWPRNATEYRSKARA